MARRYSSRAEKFSSVRKSNREKIQKKYSKRFRSQIVKNPRTGEEIGRVREGETTEQAQQRIAQEKFQKEYAQAKQERLEKESQPQTIQTQIKAQQLEPTTSQVKEKRLTPYKGSALERDTGLKQQEKIKLTPQPQGDPYRFENASSSTVGEQEYKINGSKIYSAQTKIPRVEEGEILLTDNEKRQMLSKQGVEFGVPVVTQEEYKEIRERGEGDVPVWVLSPNLDTAQQFEVAGNIPQYKNIDVGFGKSFSTRPIEEENLAQVQATRIIYGGTTLSEEEVYKQSRQYARDEFTQKPYGEQFGLIAGDYGKEIGLVGTQYLRLVQKAYLPGSIGTEIFPETDFEREIKGSPSRWYSAKGVVTTAVVGSAVLSVGGSLYTNVGAYGGVKGTIATIKSFAPPVSPFGRILRPGVYSTDISPDTVFKVEGKVRTFRYGDSSTSFYKATDVGTGSVELTGFQTQQGFGGSGVQMTRTPYLEVTPWDTYISGTSFTSTSYTFLPGVGGTGGVFKVQNYQGSEATVGGVFEQGGVVSYNINQQVRGFVPEKGTITFYFDDADISGLGTSVVNNINANTREFISGRGTGTSQSSDLIITESGFISNPSQIRGSINLFGQEQITTISTGQSSQGYSSVFTGGGKKTPFSQTFQIQQTTPIVAPEISSTVTAVTPVSVNTIIPPFLSSPQELISIPSTETALEQPQQVVQVQQQTDLSQNEMFKPLQTSTTSLVSKPSQRQPQIPIQIPIQLPKITPKLRQPQITPSKLTGNLRSAFSFPEAGYGFNIGGLPPFALGGLAIGGGSRKLGTKAKYGYVPDFTSLVRGVKGKRGKSVIEGSKRYAGFEKRPVTTNWIFNIFKKKKKTKRRKKR